ncbi:D-inositol-3-phosphate glycosyltransferase [subsurface metagenome]
MKITFCVNTTGLTGGVKVVFIYANKLTENGHQVLIVYPYNLSGKWTFKNIILFLLKWLKFDLLKIFGLTGADWFPLKAQISRVPTLSNKWIPDADVVIATANETADWVAKLPIEKGEKFYFIQNYETWTRDKKLVDDTWKLPLKKIVIANWLKKLGEEEFKQNISGMITNGVDFEKFKNPGKIYHKPKRILMMYSPLKFKGFSDGLEAYNIVKKKYPEVKLILFSAYSPGPDVPKEIEFHLNPPQNKLREIYSSCDIFVSPSHMEGCQLPPMEAMACKTAVVATDVGGVPDYTIPGKTALVVPPKKPKLLAKAILGLLKDEDKLRKISQAGYYHIRKFTWDKAAEKFERVLRKESRPEQLISEPKIAVIVLNWNQKKVTADCVSKLLRINYKNFKIIVVDNGSSDGSCEFLTKKFGSKITLIGNKKNLGYAQGNNIGIRKALKENFDFVLLVNNDVEVEKDFLKELAKIALKSPQIGMLVPKVYSLKSKKIIQSAGGFMFWRYGEARLRGHLEKDVGQYNEVKEIDFAPGVCVLVSKNVIEKIGALPKDYFMYGEDADWSFRAKKAGFRLVFVPKAKIYHYDSLSAGPESPVKTYYYIRNILIFMRKRAKKSVWFYFIPFFHIKILKMIGKYLILGKFAQIRAIILGYINFWRNEKGESKIYTFR